MDAIDDNSAPFRATSSASFISLGEREQLLVDWKQAQSLYPVEQCLHQLIADQARRTPDCIALSFQDEQLSYAQLDQRASRLAYLLHAGGVGPESLVALLAQQSIHLIVGILAVFKAGGACLPLDTALSSQHLSQILADAQPHVLLTTQQFSAQVPPNCSTSWLCLEKVVDSESFPCLSWQENTSSDPQQLAYVIYPPDSTGQPKGVMTTQQSMLDNLYAKIEDLGLQAVDCVAQNISSNFDISIWQMWAVLLQGGRVHLLSREETQRPQQLWWRVREQAITVLQLVPSLLHLLLDELEREGASEPDSLMSLEVVLTTGGALAPEIWRRWRRREPEVFLVNVYGLTECSGDVTHAWLHSDSERVPIGRPLRDARLYILDRRMEPVPVGMMGELYVGGKGIGRGYLGMPERTAANFVPDPWSQEAGARLYRTGDLVRYWKNGNLEYIGRVDELVKL